ncbi:MAG: sortase [Patescibacteria group bacterium]
MKQLKVEEKDLRRLFINDTPLAVFWRRFRQFAKQLLALAALYLLFFVLLNFGAYWTRFQYSVNAQPVEKVAVIKPPVKKIQYKPELRIPKIGVVAPLQVDVHPNIIIESLKTGVSQYAGTATPGQIGNSVIVGHSSDFPWSDGRYKNIFALLDKLTVGDQIIITYKTEKYIYVVTGQKIVAATDLSVLNITAKPTVTLLTCYPVGTSRNRLIITAKLVSDNAGSVQIGQPGSTDSLPRPR